MNKACIPKILAFLYALTSLQNHRICLKYVYDIQSDENIYKLNIKYLTFFRIYQVF
jgi:hypothetical protein